jgi:hypothetical protein
MMTPEILSAKNGPLGWYWYRCRARNPSWPSAHLNRLISEPPFALPRVCFAGSHLNRLTRTIHDRYRGDVNNV